MSVWNNKSLLPANDLGMINLVDILGFMETYMSLLIKNDFKGADMTSQDV